MTRKQILSKRSSSNYKTSTWSSSIYWAWSYCYRRADYDDKGGFWICAEHQEALWIIPPTSILREESIALKNVWWKSTDNFSHSENYQSVLKWNFETSSPRNRNNSRIDLSSLFEVCNNEIIPDNFIKNQYFKSEAGAK
jgi:hypothetical protein